MNIVSISGRLVYEPELKTVGNNKKKLPMRIAVARNDKNRTADFINAQAWGSTAEFIAKYFHKGDPIEITGKLQTDSYEKQDGTKETVTYVLVTESNFVLSKKDNSSAPAEEPKTEEPKPQAEDIGPLPFEI